MEREDCSKTRAHSERQGNCKKSQNLNVQSKYRLSIQIHIKECRSGFLQKISQVLQLSGRESKEERAKQKRQKRLHRKKVRTVLTRKDRVEFFRKRALIAFHPPKDGNCKFSALCFFLRSKGIERSPGNARKRDSRPAQSMKIDHRKAINIINIIDKN